MASVHTLFEATIGQNKPSSWWVYDHLKKFFPCKTKEQLVYFSNVLCIALPEFHLTSTCSPPGMCALVLPPVVEAELPPLENYLHEDELELQDICIHCIAAIKWLRAWLHWVDMTTWFNEARANSPCSRNHELGTLLDFLLMPENTGVSLRHIIAWVVAENMDALEVHLAKSRKLLKEALKTQTRLLTHLTKQKITLKKTHISKKTRDETQEALSQTTEQLDWARTTVAQHTADIAHIESKLEECESTDEESSYSEENGDPEPGAQDPLTATPQGHEEEEDPHDIEMQDVGDDTIPPPLLEQDDDLLPVPAQAVQSDPPHGSKEDWEGVRDDRDVIVEDERIVVKAGGTTPITLAEDQLLDDQVGTGAETPSRAVTKSLSQMNVDSPATLQVASDPPNEGQNAWGGASGSNQQFPPWTLESYKLSMEAGAPASHQMVEERRTEPGTIMMTPCTELFKKFLLT